MATRRKIFPRPIRANTDAKVYAVFIKELLSGMVKANKLIEKRNNKRLELEYDDPNG